MAFTYEQRSAVLFVNNTLAKEMRRLRRAAAEQELARLGVQLDDPAPPPILELDDVIRIAHAIAAAAGIDVQAAAERQG